MPKYKVVFPLHYGGKQYEVGETVEFDKETGDFLSRPIGPAGLAYLEKVEEDQPKKATSKKKEKE